MDAGMAGFDRLCGPDGAIGTLFLSRTVAGNVAPGWYVDDMVIETGPLAVMVLPGGV